MLELRSGRIRLTGLSSRFAGPAFISPDIRLEFREFVRSIDRFDELSRLTARNGGLEVVTFGVVYELCKLRVTVELEVGVCMIRVSSRSEGWVTIFRLSFSGIEVGV